MPRPQATPFTDDFAADLAALRSGPRQQATTDDFAADLAAVRSLVPLRPVKLAPPPPVAALLPNALPLSTVTETENLITPRLAKGHSPIVTVGGRRGRFNFDEPAETGGTPKPRYAFDADDGGRWFFQLEKDLQGGRWEHAHHAEADFRRYKALPAQARTATMAAMWGDTPIANTINTAASEDISFAELQKRLEPYNTNRQISEGEPKPVTAAPRHATFLDRLADLGLSALKSTISVPEAAVGLADIPTGGRVGKALERVGFKPAEASAILDTYYSEQQQRANRTMAEAEGILDATVKALKNPSVIAHSVVQSAPLMLGGAGIARWLVKMGVPMVAAAGAGEGAATAGIAAEQIRRESPAGTLTPKQAAVATASGVLTGTIGAFGARVAKALKIADVDTLLAGAVRDPVARRNLVQATVKAAVQEGFVEELPQSIQEAIAQNVATGKPWHQGVSQEGVLGALAGGLMGGGSQIAAALPVGIAQQPPVAVPTATSGVAVAPQGQTFADVVAAGPPPPTSPLGAPGATATAAASQAGAFRLGDIATMSPETRTALARTEAAAAPPASQQPERREVGRTLERRVREGVSHTGAERRVTDVSPPTQQREDHTFSSTQVNLPAELATKIRELALAIPDEDIAPNGRAGDSEGAAPHVTVKYGLHTNDVKKVRDVLKDEPPIRVTLGATSFFPNSESTSGDVLKFDVDSPDLHRVNAKIAEVLEVTDTHPTYTPHVTVAYLKPGKGERYAGDASLKGQTVTIDTLRFSTKEGRIFEIPLTGHPPAKSLITEGSARLPSPSVEIDKKQSTGREIAVVDTETGGKEPVSTTIPTQPTSGGKLEPWQQTRREFRTAENQPRVDAIRDAIERGTPIVLTTYQRATRLWRPSHIRLALDGGVQMASGKSWVTLTDPQIEHLAAQAGVQPVPLDQQVFHRVAIEEALQAGHAVPAAVLAEYPDVVDTPDAEAQTVPRGPESEEGVGAGAAGRGALDRIAASQPVGLESHKQRETRRATHYKQVFTSVLADAKAHDPLVDRNAVKAQFDARIALIDELDAEFLNSGQNPRALLEAIAAQAGISVDAEQLGGLSGELRWLREGAAGPYGNFGGVPNVFRKRRNTEAANTRTGLSLDEMATRLQQDARFAHITGPHELLEALEGIARRGAVGARGAVYPGTAELATRAGIRAGEAWWTDSWTQEPQASEPEPLTAETYRAAFGGTQEQAEAIVTVYEAMGIPLDRLKVAKGADGSNVLYQDATEPAPIFYSKLTHVVSEKMPNRSSVKQILEIVSNPKNGVKADELQWSGLKEWLAGRDSATKAEVVAFLAANQIQVKIVELPAVKFAQYTLLGGENYRELLLILPRRAASDEYTKRFNEIRSKYGVGQGPQLAKLWTSEESEELNQLARAANAETATTFKGPHYDEPNVIAHIRFNERTDAQGQKVLFIEEVQSDWHQKGRRHGYKSDAQAAFEKIKAEVETKHGRSLIDLRGQRELWTQEIGGDLARVDEASGRYQDEKYGSSVPDAPFKTTWQELSMKRMLRYAAEHGYDVLAWTTGEQQNERYNLSKQVDQIQWEQQGGHTLVEIVLKDNIQRLPVFVDATGVVSRVDGHERQDWVDKPLGDVVGKDVADTIASELSGVLTGDRLRLGGSGMRGFYDDILPRFMDHYGKAWGVHTHDVRLHVPTALFANDSMAHAAALGVDPVHGILITDTAKSAVMQGQPLFQGPKASVEFTEHGEAVIRALKNPDVSSGLHEAAHVARRFLFDRSIQQEVREGISDEDILTAEEWAGAKDGAWDRDAEEKFARGFERYFHDGEAPNASLKRLFERFSHWLGRIYKTISGTLIDVEISPAMRQVYDTLMTRSERLAEAGSFDVKTLEAESGAAGEDVLYQEGGRPIPPAGRTLTEAQLAKIATARNLPIEFLRVRAERAGYQIVATIPRPALPPETEIDADEYFNFRRVNLSDEEATALRAEIERTVRATGRQPKERVTFREIRDDARELSPEMVELLAPYQEQQAQFRAVRMAARQRINALNRRLIVQQRELDSLVDEERGTAQHRIQQMERDRRTLLDTWMRMRSEDGRNLALHRMMADSTWEDGRGFDHAYWLSRARRAMGLPPGTDLPVKESQILNDILRRGDEVATTGAGDPVAIQEELADFLRRLDRSGWLEMITALRKAGLLTGIKTIGRNMGGNFAFQVAEELSRAPAVVVDVALSAVTGRRTVQGVTPQAAANATYAAATEGVHQAWNILRTGASRRDLMKTDVRRELNSGYRWVDAYVNTVFRFMGAQDRLFRSYAFRRSLEEQVKVRALNTGEDTTQLLLQPTEAMIAHAITDAEFATFNNPNIFAAGLEKGLSWMRRTGRAGRVGAFAIDNIALFKNTPSNIVARVLDYTPLGAVPRASASVIDALVNTSMTAEQQRAFSLALGRGAVGTALLTLGWYLAAAGAATGADDDTEGDRNVAGAARRLPGAILVDGRWRQVAPFSPVGNLITIGATMYREATRPLREEARRLGRLGGVASRVLLEQPMLTGLHDVIEALGQPSARSEAVASSTLGSFVPTLVADAAGLFDPYRRDARPDGLSETLVNGLRARLPGLRNALPVREDVFGRPEAQIPTALWDPTIATVAREMDDVVLTELIKHDVSVGWPARRPNETRDHYRLRARVVGKEISRVLRRVVAHPRYRAASPERQLERLEDAITTARQRVPPDRRQDRLEKQDRSLPAPPAW